MNYSRSKKTHVIYKIPARSHISIPDLIDLRLLKKLICSGIKVSVIILDIPYTSDNSVFNQDWSKITKQRIVNILGKKPNVINLTDLLSLNPHNSFKLICTKLIPFFCKCKTFKNGF
ncbi:hypothetical protein ES705_32860 [subsurface metagenome]